MTGLVEFVVDWVSRLLGKSDDDPYLTQLYLRHDSLYDQATQAFAFECDYPKAHLLFREAAQLNNTIEDYRSTQ